MSTPSVLTSMGAITSDAEAGKVKEGRFLKLSECPTSFQAHFNNAREVRWSHSEWYTRVNCGTVNPPYVNIPS